MHPDTESVKELLRTTTLRQLLEQRPPGTPIVLKSDVTIGEALQTMAEADILSAPVLNACKGMPGTAFLGWLDVADIVCSLLKELFPTLLDPALATCGAMKAYLATDGASEVACKARHCSRIALDQRAFSHTPRAASRYLGS